MALDSRQGGGARGRGDHRGRCDHRAVLLVLPAVFSRGQPGLVRLQGAPGRDLLPVCAGLFDLRGVTFAAWTLAAFSIGVLAGALIRRVVPAIVATLVVYAGLAFAVGGFLRQHYVAPLVTSKLNIPSSAWVISQQWFTAAGRPASPAALNQVLLKAPADLAGKGGIPKSLTVWQYLAHHGFTQLTTYQPDSRFWSFQWIEGGWLVALSVLLVTATAWLVRRRAT